MRRPATSVIFETGLPCFLGLAGCQPARELEPYLFFIRCPPRSRDTPCLPGEPPRGTPHPSGCYQRPRTSTPGRSGLELRPEALGEEVGVPGPARGDVVAILHHEGGPMVRGRAAPGVLARPPLELARGRQGLADL